jgi:hypothetical protein
MWKILALFYVALLYYLFSRLSHKLAKKSLFKKWIFLEIRLPATPAYLDSTH